MCLSCTDIGASSQQNPRRPAKRGSFQHLFSSTSKWLNLKQVSHLFQTNIHPEWKSFKLFMKSVNQVKATLSRCFSPSVEPQAMPLDWTHKGNIPLHGFGDHLWTWSDRSTRTARRDKSLSECAASVCSTPGGCFIFLRRRAELEAYFVEISDRLPCLQVITMIQETAEHETPVKRWKRVTPQICFLNEFIHRWQSLIQACTASHRMVLL